MILYDDQGQGHIKVKVILRSPKWVVGLRLKGIFVYWSSEGCDAKPKPVSRKFQSKHSRLPQSTKGRGEIYYAKSEVLELESNYFWGV